MKRARLGSRSFVLKICLWGTLALAGAGMARAGEISVQLEPGPGAAYATEAGVPLSQIESALRTELEALYRASDARRYIQAFGDAQAFANRGLGADYASNPRKFIIGFAVNVSATTDEAYVDSRNGRQPPIDGVGANFSVMAGTNLDWAGLRPVTIYANYFRASGAYERFDGTTENFGVHGQVKLFEDVHDPKRSSVFGWGGIDVTTGLQYGRLSLTLADAVTSRIPLASGAGAPYIEANTSGSFNADMRVWSVPIEVTTNVRLFYLLSLYGGFGYDWQFGTNELSMDLNSTLLGVVPPGGDKVNVGTARLTARESVSPTTGKLRSLVGVQVNLTVLRVFTHVNVMPDRGLIGVVAGARLAF